MRILDRQPQYIPKIIAALQEADLSKYTDSMRPLIENDISETEQKLRDYAQDFLYK